MLTGVNFYHSDQASNIALFAALICFIAIIQLKKWQSLVRAKRDELCTLVGPHLRAFLRANLQNRKKVSNLGTHNVVFDQKQGNGTLKPKLEQLMPSAPVRVLVKLIAINEFGYSHKSLWRGKSNDYSNVFVG